jgi:hypothetical protein
VPPPESASHPSKTNIAFTSTHPRSKVISVRSLCIEAPVAAHSIVPIHTIRQSDNIQNQRHPNKQHRGHMSSDTMTMPTHMNGAPASSTYSHRSRGNTYTEEDPIHQYARYVYHSLVPSYGLSENTNKLVASSSNTLATRWTTSSHRPAMKTTADSQRRRPTTRPPPPCKQNHHRRPTAFHDPTMNA